MKKLVFIIMVVAISIASGNALMAQRIRYSVKGAIESGSTKVNIIAKRFDYQIETDNMVKKDNISATNSINVNLIVIYSKELVALVSKLKTVKVTLTIEDNYADKETTRKFEFLDADFSFAESKGIYDDDDNIYGKECILTLKAKSIVIDGNVVTPK
jgi:hypothetical protein